MRGEIPGAQGSLVPLPGRASLEAPHAPPSEISVFPSLDTSQRSESITTPPIESAKNLQTLVSNGVVEGITRAAFPELSASTVMYARFDAHTKVADSCRQRGAIADNDALKDLLEAERKDIITRRDNELKDFLEQNGTKDKITKSTSKDSRYL